MKKILVTGGNSYIRDFKITEIDDVIIKHKT